MYIALNLSEHTRGNNGLLYDKDYVDIVKQCIKETIEQYRTDDFENLFETSFIIDDQLLWETIKLLIRGRTISYSSFKKKERERVERQLENLLLEWETKGVEKNEEIAHVESELKKLREEKIKGIIMRSKAKWNVEGERSSKYFCNLEKRNFTEKIIPKLILDNGTEITNQADILKEQKSFYENLYSCKKKQR